MSQSNISMDQIEALKKRADVGYKEAKELLEKHDGDIIEALIELENKKKTYANQNPNEAKGLMAKLKNLYKKGNKTKLIITLNEETIANVPINFVIIFSIFGFYLALFTIILILVTGCNTSIKKAHGAVLDIDDVLVDLSKDEGERKVCNMNSSKNCHKEPHKNKSRENVQAEEIEESTENSQKVNLEKNAYNEYTVE